MRSAHPSHDPGAMCPFPAGTTGCEPCVTPAKPRQHRCVRRQLWESQWTLTPPREPRLLTTPRNGGHTPPSSRTGTSGVGWRACSTRAVPGRARRRWSAARTPRPFVTGSSAPRPSTDHPADAAIGRTVLYCRAWKWHQTVICRLWRPLTSFGNHGRAPNALVSC